MPPEKILDWPRHIYAYINTRLGNQTSWRYYAFGPYHVDTKKVLKTFQMLESSKFAAGSHGIIRLESGFFALRSFKIARFCIQVTCHHEGDRFESIYTFFAEKNFC